MLTCPFAPWPQTPPISRGKHVTDSEILWHAAGWLEGISVIPRAASSCQWLLTPATIPLPRQHGGSRKQTPLPPQAAASPEGALGIRSPPLPLSDLQSLCPQDQAQPQLELGKAKSGPQQGPPMSLLLNKGKMTILAWHKGTYARLAGPNGHK